MKRILQVFRTYCDCYLEFVNNWISGSSFCEFYGINPDEWLQVVKAAKMVKNEGGRYSEIDYYFNIGTNEFFTEKSAIF